MKRGLKQAYDLSELQERVSALKQQMAPLLSSPVVNDRIMLDFLTGAFYLRSDVQKNGMQNATKLGTIDIERDYDQYHAAARQVLHEKITAKLNAPRPKP